MLALRNLSRIILNGDTDGVPRFWDIPRRVRGKPKGGEAREYGACPLRVTIVEKQRDRDLLSYFHNIHPDIRIITPQSEEV